MRSKSTRSRVQPAASSFVRSFALGRDNGVQWLLHCPGALALARNEAPDSGGTGFYAVPVRLSP